MFDKSIIVTIYLLQIRHKGLTLLKVTELGCDAAKSQTQVLWLLSPGS